MHEWHERYEWSEWHVSKKDRISEWMSAREREREREREEKRRERGGHPNLPITTSPISFWGGFFGYVDFCVFLKQCFKNFEFHQDPDLFFYKCEEMNLSILYSKERFGDDKQYKVYYMGPSPRILVIIIVIFQKLLFGIHTMV